MWAHYLNFRNKKEKHLIRMVVLNIQTKEDKENEKIDQFSKLRVKISIKINP